MARDSRYFNARSDVVSNPTDYLNQNKTPDMEPTKTRNKKLLVAKTTQDKVRKHSCPDATVKEIDTKS